MSSSWVDDLMNLGGGLVDMVGESLVSVGSAYGTALANKDKNTPNVNELTAQPEVNKQREPIKGQNADGTPIVVGQNGQPLVTGSQWIAGVDNRLVLAGAGLVGLLMVLRR